MNKNIKEKNGKVFDSWKRKWINNILLTTFKIKMERQYNGTTKQERRGNSNNNKTLVILFFGCIFKEEFKFKTKTDTFFIFYRKSCTCTYLQSHPTPLLEKISFK